jgi:hypothetical protein
MVGTRRLITGVAWCWQPIRARCGSRLEDVRNELVSTSAWEDYGVIVDPKTLKMDLAETENRKKMLKKSHKENAISRGVF